MSKEKQNEEFFNKDKKAGLNGGPTDLTPLDEFFEERDKNTKQTIEGALEELLTRAVKETLKDGSAQVRFVISIQIETDFNHE